MNTPTRKATLSRIAWSTGALFLISFAVYMFMGLVAVDEPAAAPPGAAKPKITWTPEAVTVALQPGQTTTAVASFTPSESLAGVTLEVVPALRSMVTVTPTSLPSVQKGQVVSITLTFATSVNALPATLDGTLHVRSGSSTIARPLPIVLSVVWPTATLPHGGASLTYPSHFVAATYETEGVLSLTPRTEDIAAEVPSIFVRSEANPAGLTFHEYFDGDPGNNLIDQSAPFGPVPISVGGRTAYRVRAADGLAGFVSVVIPAAGRFIVVLDAGFAFQASGEFDQIVNSIRIVD